MVFTFFRHIFFCADINYTRATMHFNCNMQQNLHLLYSKLTFKNGLRNFRHNGRWRRRLRMCSSHITTMMCHMGVHFYSFRYLYCRRRVQPFDVFPTRRSLLLTHWPLLFLWLAGCVGCSVVVCFNTFIIGIVWGFNKVGRFDGFLRQVTTTFGVVDFHSLKVKIRETLSGSFWRRILVLKTGSPKRRDEHLLFKVWWPYRAVDMDIWRPLENEGKRPVVYIAARTSHVNSR